MKILIDVMAWMGVVIFGIPGLIFMGCIMRVGYIIDRPHLVYDTEKTKEDKKDTPPAKSYHLKIT